MRRWSLAVMSASWLLVAQASASPFFFSTGSPDGKMATASRPGSTGKVETESADDFVTSALTSITAATFTGLLPSTATPGDILKVAVEIYRVFPFDSTNPPSGNVPTRVNSPSDVAFGSRASDLGQLSFASSVLSSSFTASNSVVSGINKTPNQTTGGEGAVTGQEVRFDVTFSTPFLLPADHYFFVPLVQLAGSGNFLWLSAPRPIVAPGTPFSPDLQSWIRNASLDPDWLRVGTDIVGGAPAPTFNAAFTLTGTTTSTSVPEPASLALVGLGLAGLGASRRRREA
jgi:hypothetical protein